MPPKKKVKKVTTLLTPAEERRLLAHERSGVDDKHIIDEIALNITGDDPEGLEITLPQKRKKGGARGSRVPTSELMRRRLINQLQQERQREFDRGNYNAGVPPLSKINADLDFLGEKNEPQPKNPFPPTRRALSGGMMNEDEGYESPTENIIPVPYGIAAQAAQGDNLLDDFNAEATPAGPPVVGDPVTPPSTPQTNPNIPTVSPSGEGGSFLTDALAFAPALARAFGGGYDKGSLERMVGGVVLPDREYIRRNGDPLFV